MGKSDGKSSMTPLGNTMKTTNNGSKYGVNSVFGNVVNNVMSTVLGTGVSAASNSGLTSSSNSAGVENSVRNTNKIGPTDTVALTAPMNLKTIENDEVMDSTEDIETAPTETESKGETYEGIPSSNRLSPSPYVPMPNYNPSLKKYEVPSHPHLPFPLSYLPTLSPEE